MVEIFDTPMDEDLVDWAGPLVCNQNKKPKDVWLEEGTALTADLLPDAMEFTVQEEGVERQTEVSLRWAWASGTGGPPGRRSSPGNFSERTDES